MDNQATARNLTLWELLTEYIIEIPIIQRDYAQGRKANSTIRNNILESFHKALTTDQKLELDFIYASKSGDVIQPLDGQQRLTTLFLSSVAVKPPTSGGGYKATPQSCLHTDGI